MEQLDFNKIIFDLVNYEQLQKIRPRSEHTSELGDPYLFYAKHHLPILKLSGPGPPTKWPTVSSIQPEVQWKRLASPQQWSWLLHVTWHPSMHIKRKQVLKKKIRKKKRKSYVIRLPHVKKRKEFCLNSNEWFWFHSCWRYKRNTWYNLSCLLQTYCQLTTKEKLSADMFFRDLWRNQLWKWLEEGCHKPVLGVWPKNKSGHHVVLIKHINRVKDRSILNKTFKTSNCVCPLMTRYWLQ